MKYNRLSWLCAAALLFGCSAGVKQQTGTGGASASGGGTGKGGNGASGGATGSGGEPSGSGGSMGTVDASGLDGACAASSTGAEPVPLTSTS